VRRTGHEARARNRTLTLFRLASTTKPVTAVAVLILMEEGKLLLTDPVAKYIPEFKGAKVAMANPPGSAERYSTVPANREITIIDLLTHTSGLASDGITTPDFARLVNARKPTESLADYIPRFGSLPLDFQPGARWHYSGLAGFETLSRIVEIASGMPFDRFLKQRLFGPLGMTDTVFDVPEKDAGRLVTVYRRAADGLHPPDRPLPLGSRTFFSGAAGLTSTASDYLRFAQMLVNGGQIDGKRILSPRTVDLMLIAGRHIGHDDVDLIQSGSKTSYKLVVLNLEWPLSKNGSLRKTAKSPRPRTAGSSVIHCMTAARLPFMSASEAGASWAAGSRRNRPQQTVHEIAP
jgi:CubicO group peptidase (beta-lactamase class C family)